MPARPERNSNAARSWSLLRQKLEEILCQQHWSGSLLFSRYNLHSHLRVRFRCLCGYNCRGGSATMAIVVALALVCCSDRFLMSANNLVHHEVHYFLHFDVCRCFSVLHVSLAFGVCSFHFLQVSRMDRAHERSTYQFHVFIKTVDRFVCVHMLQYTKGTAVSPIMYRVRHTHAHLLLDGDIRPKSSDTSNTLSLCKPWCLLLLLFASMTRSPTVRLNNFLCSAISPAT